VYTPWPVMRHLSNVYSSNDEGLPPTNYWIASGASTIFQNLLTNEACSGNHSIISTISNITKLGYSNLKYDSAISLLQYDLKDATNDERIFTYLLVNSGYLNVLTINQVKKLLSLFRTLK
jgi:hypothetical protein